MQDELLLEFCEEAAELLQGLPEKLVDHQQDPSGDHLNGVFRAVHTIKGNAGFFGLAGVNSYAHGLEDALDRLRQSDQPIQDDFCRQLVAGLDALCDLVARVGTDAAATATAPQAELLAKIKDSCSAGQGRPEAAHLQVLLDDMQAACVRSPQLVPWVQRWRQAMCRLAGSPRTETPATAEVLSGAEAAPLATEAEPAEKSPGKEESECQQGPASGSSTGAAAAKGRALRIPEARVDQFLEDVSQLFITCEQLKDLQSRLLRRYQTNGLLDELRQINATLSRQSTVLQRSVVELRKVPIGGLFGKFPRVARTLAEKLDKQLDVHLSGQDAEVDKSLVEDLDGPLMHMVRNVCDHAIESPAERTARGRPPLGNLWIGCGLTKTHVVITVRDDGRGIDPQRLRQKSVERGLLTADQAAALSDAQAVELIFHPGFSTAETVTDISGRGVGMDAVRATIREHNGDVRVASRLGEGTEFRIEIPIRRAVVVIDGLLLAEQKSTFVLPFSEIREIVKLDESMLGTARGRLVARIRGEPHAAVTLAELLGMPVDDSAPESRTGVLVHDRGEQLCLLVERVLGQRKVVVTELDRTLPCSDQIRGVSQLGGGQLALVLHGGELIRQTRRQATATVRNGDRPR